MKKLSVILLTLLLVLAIGACAATENGNQEIDWQFYNTRAESFVSLMARDSFEAAFSEFDETMQQALPVAELRNLWDLIIAQAGEYTSTFEFENLYYDGYFISFVTSWHEISGVTLRVVFSEDGQVAGLFIDGYPAL